MEFNCNVQGISTVFAGEKTEKVEVKGNCGMCEKRIEKATLSVKGVSNADWDQETKSIEVTYDDQKTNTQQIQTAITMAGHDTQLFSASDQKYSELPDCCKYQRDKSRKNMNHGASTECNHNIKATSGSCCENK